MTDASPDGDTFRVFGLFLAGTFGFSWGLWALLLFEIVQLSAMGALARIGGFGPLVGALVALLATDRSVREWIRSNVRIQIPARWYAWALLLPPLFIGTAGIVHVVAFGAQFDLDAMNPLWVYPIAVVVVFFVGGGQEELGWRGFALPALQQRFSAVTASVGIGFVWALWHLPLFFLPGSAQSALPFGPYLVAILSASVVLTWLYNASGSVLIPMLYHGGINPIGAYFPTGGISAVETVTGYGSYTIVLVGAVVVLLGVYGFRDLSNSDRVTLSALVSVESRTDQ